MTRRVVVTGLGAVTPVGNDVPTMWANLVAGRSGIGPITLFDTSDLAVTIAGEVKGFDVAGKIEPKEARRMDRSTQFAVVAARQALEDADLRMDREDPEQVGVIIGSAAGGLATLLDQEHIRQERGPRRVSPFFLPNMLCDAASGQVAIATGAKGPNMAIVSACATGSGAIGEAAETIRRGDAEVVITGGTEASIVPLVMAGFVVMGALGTDDDPTKASKPFDAWRNGFIVSEAGAALILESLEHAINRGARIYGEVVGYGATNDAFHMAASAEGGEGAARTMRMALRKAGIAPDEVDYVNAHGTSTPLNDKSETAAIKAVFGDHAYRMPVSSTKSMTGHMMGASGAVEAIVCLLTIRDGCIAPTINYDVPDPQCDLDYVPTTARAARVRTALSNSMGLGGHNSSIVLRAFES
ncbi:MAG: beta-ketoacyl-ACP synthase II [Chloroflexota bacterium]